MQWIQAKKKIENFTVSLLSTITTISTINYSIKMDSVNKNKKTIEEKKHLEKILDDYRRFLLCSPF
tara:strand:- start:14 stop:211 length:198 start_codon:yes stop_codon:yes gene_type:complete